MKLIIDSYIEQGDIADERVAFRATEDCNLKFYMVVLVEKISDQYFSQPIKSFWFPPKDVKKGDWIVIYTKGGPRTSKANEDGTTSYFYYLDLESAVYNKDNDGLVIVEISTWNTKYRNQ